MDEIKNTLLLGNGFNRAVYPGAPDWGSLYGNEQERLSLSNAIISNTVIGIPSFRKVGG